MSMIERVKPHGTTQYPLPRREMLGMCRIRSSLFPKIKIPWGPGKRAPEHTVGEPTRSGTISGSVPRDCLPRRSRSAACDWPTPDMRRFPARSRSEACLSRAVRRAPLGMPSEPTRRRDRFRAGSGQHPETADVLQLMSVSVVLRWHSALAGALWSC